MAAAAIVPTSVHLLNSPANLRSGTLARFEKYLIEVAKATQNDWVVFATYVPGTIQGVLGAYTIDGSGDGVVETNTYTASGTKLNLTSATVGTTFIEVLVKR